MQILKSSSMPNILWKKKFMGKNRVTLTEEK